VELVRTPFVVPPVDTVSAMDAYEAVLAGAGALLPVRDSVDSRIVAEVRQGSGRIIDSQRQVGSWPEYRPGEMPRDSDGDGMPDEWETAHGLNPREPKDGTADRDRDGYTNIEEYLNGLARRLPPRPGKDRGDV